MFLYVGIREKLEEVFSKVFVKGGLEGDEYFSSLLNYTPESTLAEDIILKVDLLVYFIYLFMLFLGSSS